MSDNPCTFTDPVSPKCGPQLQDDRRALAFTFALDPIAGELIMIPGHDGRVTFGLHVAIMVQADANMGLCAISRAHRALQ